MVSALIMSTKPDTTIFAHWLCSSAIRRPARLSAGSTGAPNSGLSMSLGYFCRSICAVYGSAAEYWRWLRKSQATRLHPNRADDAQHRGTGVLQKKQGYDIVATIDC